MDCGRIPGRTDRGFLPHVILLSPPKVKLYYNNITGRRAVLPPLDFFSIFVGLIDLISSMGRILAIDFGKKRCGIAVTDTLRIVANPLETVETPRLTDFVKTYIAAEPVDMIVVGLPRTMAGDLSESNRWLQPAIGRLRKAVAPLPVEFYDERFTSVLAHRAMLDGGLKRMDRRDKGTVDRVSAAIILNDYLTSINNKPI